MQTPPESETTSAFVWIIKPPTTASAKGKEKEKTQPKNPDSTPLTRQGYRTGRLAEDFWTVVGMSHTPNTLKKKLRVILVIIKSLDPQYTTGNEYLVDKSTQPSSPIALVHVGESLARIP